MSNTVRMELPPQRSGERIVGPFFGFSAMLLVNAIYLVYKGVFIAPDSSFYMNGADGLLAAGFDFQRFLHDTPAFGQYIGFVTWCAILKSIFGDSWPVAVVATNALANALTVGVLTFHLKRVRVGWQARLGMIVWCLIAFDLLVWSKGLLSDPTFLVLATSAVTLSASCIRRSERSIARHVGMLILAGLLSGAALCWRPTGIALIIPLGVCLGLQLVPPRLHWKRVFTLLAVVALVEAGFLVFAHYMAEPESWPLPVGGGNIKYTAHYYDQGQVVWKRYATYHSEPESLLDYHLITLDRLRYWFACYESEFSLGHKLYNCVFYIPLFAGSAGAVILWTFGAFRNNADRDRLVTVLLSMVLAFSVMHAMLQVDYGWRYRVPIIPCLLLLTAITADAARQAWKQRATGMDAPATVSSSGDQ
ncbi:MAG: hypothetical protein HQ518_10835 [Rhodopirellula sp.]|nr:hypothetical protein [Rhodopirellula sp.]